MNVEDLITEDGNVINCPEFEIITMTGKARTLYIDLDLVREWEEEEEEKHEE